MDIKDKFSDHWLYLFLAQHKNLFNQKAINAIDQYAHRVTILDDPLTMVPMHQLPQLVTTYNSNDPNFHLVIDKNYFAYVLQRTWHPVHQHNYHFQTCGPAYDYINGIHIELSYDDILFVSQEQINVDVSQMFGRYDNQLLQVYQTIPRTIYPEEDTSISDMITRSFKELQGPWATLNNSLTMNP